MAAEKCSEVVRKIASSSSKKEVLESLQELSALINSASCNLRDVSPHIPLDVLFGCFNTSNHEQITLCKWLLNKLLPLVKSDVIVSKYHDLIIEGLNHPSVEVRELCLSELQRCSSNVHGLLALLEKTDVLVYTARALADDNLSCAQKAAEVLKSASRHESGLKMIFEHELQSEFDELLLKKDVIRFRIYELFVAIQALSSEAFRSCKDSGILMKLLNELNGEDVLLRMNCVELLTELANSGKNGLDFLEDAGVLVKLNNVLLSLESDPMVSLMIPGVIKFFGYLAQERPDDIIERYPQFLEKVFFLLSCDDLTLVPIAVETLGILAQRDIGLKVVFNNPARNKHIMKALGNCVMSSNAVIRMRALEALAVIFESMDHPSEALSAFVKPLYDDLSPNSLQMLMSLAKQPFENVRGAALRVMKSLAKYKWAQQDMTVTPGFLEYLLDRQTEPDKSGKEHKYNLIVELVHSPSSAEVFDKPYLLHLREYEREGPFCVRAQAAVAMGESN